MSKRDNSTFRFRPNPKRQLILVVLAVCGLALGYGLGFVFKRPIPVIPEPLPAHPSPTQQPERKAEPAKQMPELQPVLPEPSASPQEVNVRAYEEALPKEIVVVMETIPTTSATQQQQPVTSPESVVESAVEQTKPLSVPETGSPEPPVLLKQRQDTQIANVPISEPLPHTPRIKTATWQRNTVSIKLDGRPQIAIVMDDLGIDRGRTRRTLALPGPLSLSFLAYAMEVNAQAAKGRAGGHEIWLHIPMEPSSSTVDPGPNVLLSGEPKAELLRSLNWNLDQLHDYVGVNNHMGSRFTADLEGMRGVMGELQRRGLAFLDSVTSANSVGHKVAREAGIPFTLRNIFLDHEDDLETINKQLAKVEKLAKSQGYAIAIGHPRETTLKALAPWLETLEQRGFQLVPVSALLRVPAEQAAKQ
jgi:uncharacterized protein